MREAFPWYNVSIAFIVCRHVQFVYTGKIESLGTAAHIISNTKRTTSPTRRHTACDSLLCDFQTAYGSATVAMGRFTIGN